ncbi:MAG TPA: hypothetical protein VMS86_06505 [Thermoanaerobaculia bacterium]|nr:hypothetical protein [Thermoanaerobaculia bacterium]
MKPRGRMGWLAAVLALATTGPVWSQGDCGAGSVYDDGTFENGYGAKPSVGWSEYVMRFDPPPGARRLERVCVCWTRNGPDSSVAFDLNVYSVGLDGKPLDLLGSRQAFAFGVPSHPGSRFYSYDLSELDIGGDAPLFIGPAWSPVVDAQLYVCADQSGDTVRPGYANLVSPGAVPAQTITDVFANYKALGLRAEFDAPCEPRADTLCLNRNRFQVQIEWLRPNGESGSGKAVTLPGREDSGLFWFFDQGNLEMLVKVLDRCVPPFESFWVFYAATTNVGFELVVTDTVTGDSKVYTNPVGMTALPVQDTQAFKTCDAEADLDP